MSRTANSALTAALPQRARLALEMARQHDDSCDETTAFCLAESRPYWGVHRLQKAIRSQTRRERGQRVFTPPWSMPASGLPLTADLDLSAPGLPEPHHLDDPAALYELFDIIEELDSDPAARARLARVDEQDAVARHQTALAAKALNLSRRRAQQMRRAAVQADNPQREWGVLVWRSASHATAKTRRAKAARARRRLGVAPGQLSLLEG